MFVASDHPPVPPQRLHELVIGLQNFSWKQDKKQNIDVLGGESDPQPFQTAPEEGTVHPWTCLEHGLVGQPPCSSQLLFIPLSEVQHFAHPSADFWPLSSYHDHFEI